MNINGLSSPLTLYTNYTNSIELLANISYLSWSINPSTKEILFELHVHTTGWIGLGISPAGGMPGADIGIGWVSSTGNVTFQDRYAYNFSKPVLDSTTTDWFALQGREENGWTAIQFKRLLDTCDSMDYPIKSGTNIVIFAWGLTDPDASTDITYHETRRGSRVIPLRSYNQPPAKEKFAGLDKIEFRANNYTVPANGTLYFCKVFSVPSNFTGKRHAIAHEILIDSSSQDIVYHFTLNECDPTATFDDSNLPYGNCDDNVTAYSLCNANIVIPWAIGGDNLIDYPDEAGFPIGQNFSIKYYMIQINYINPTTGTPRVDNTGIRLYIGNELRLNDVGGFTLGMDSSPLALAIPPNVSNFMIDTYCPAVVSNTFFPTSGLKVFSFFGHTHMTGRSLWTKIIRNTTAVQYVFNAESYDRNHQFEHRLSPPIQLYQGDEFVARCAYNTINRTQVTMGGRRPIDEMCVQVLIYYPRMSNLYTCASRISPVSWQQWVNVSATDMTPAAVVPWLLNVNWTSPFIDTWKTFYNTAGRLIAYGRAGFYNITGVPTLPTYTDLSTGTCNIGNGTSSTSTTITTTTTATTTTTRGSGTDRNFVIHHEILIFFVFLSFLIHGIIY